MKLVSGKELFEGFSGISKSLDALSHLAKGDEPCKRCGGTGWHPPGRWRLFRNWMAACPVWAKPFIPANAPAAPDADPAGGNA